jgi:dienelactone hydrolase
VQLTISATAVSDPTVTGSAALTFAAIAVSLSATPSSIEATATSTITATVSYDPANAGVDPASWAIVGSNGTLSARTNSSVTYTAPAAPPADDATVMIVAAAASDSTRTANTTLTVLAITIQMVPGSALIPVNHGSQQFTVTIQNDPATPSQVNWAVTQSAATCTSGCGNVSPSTTASGSPTTYQAPSTVPANPSVLLTAASATDPTKVTDAGITLTNGVVQVVPTNLNFGVVKTNQSRSSTVSLTNTGATALTINGVSITGTNAGYFSTTNNCGSSLAASASCQITATFRPKEAGTSDGTLNINDSSSDSPQQVSMVGRARNFQFEVNHAAVNFALSANKAPSVPPPTGSAKVGTRLLDLIDSTRSDPFLTTGAKRELLVRLWYPAADAENCPRAEYSSVMVWRAFSELAGVSLPQVTTNSCWNLPVAAGPHPVVIFTPGYTGTFTDYTFLFEDLASRGYVVASVDHTFEATAVEFPDGRFVQSVFGSHLGTDTLSDEASMAFAVSVRLSDLEFLANQLEVLNGGADGHLTGKLDMTRVALAGHSLGGLTTILAVERDARFRAGIVIDGATPNAPFLDTDTPMLLLAAGRDTWAEEEDRLWNSLHGPRLAVNLRGSEHVTPSDLIWLAPGAVETGTMGAQKTIAAVRNYIAAFLDANLSDITPDTLLTGSPAEYPDVVVTTRNQPLHAKPN